ncbi:CGNR zinc finger domain-containing protein [Mycobacterium paraintracellulare]|uniref:CGNR zinc finger domain-containing protein n=1 Tax=Mycobacterium paraintracellulare TaxID=1138383 RepID=UPI0019154064|nr:CGNR zinc finger domain-containing protein [Mycobacterium paraintracellulare]
MNWAATARYAVTPAPGSLGLVHDFLNTRSAGNPRQRDLLDSAASAQQWVNAAASSWSIETGEEQPQVSLAAPDCRVLRDFRSALLATVIGGAVDSAEPLAGGVPFSANTKLEIQLRDDGLVQVIPSGAGWRMVIAWVLSEVYRAQQSGEWHRLKSCRNKRCHTVFYDRSRNNSGVWHNVRTCGNAINLRASRARRKNLVDASSPISLVEPTTLTPDP